jgi:hypothetical protein
MNGAARDQSYLAVSDPDPDQRGPGEVAVVRVDLGNHSPVSDQVGGQVADAPTYRVVALDTTPCRAHSRMAQQHESAQTHTEAAVSSQRR